MHGYIAIAMLFYDIYIIVVQISYDVWALLEDIFFCFSV